MMLAHHGALDKLKLFHLEDGGFNHQRDYKGDFSFSATGGTEIQGSYIDNSRGPMGSNIDLSQHDF